MHIRSKRQLLVAQQLLAAIERNGDGGTCDECRQHQHSPTCAIAEAARALARIIPPYGAQDAWLKST